MLRWESTPYIGRRNRHDHVADVPGGLGRYRVKKRPRKPEYEVRYNNDLVAVEPTLDAAKRRAEIGAKLLSKKMSG